MALIKVGTSFIETSSLTYVQLLSEDSCVIGLTTGDTAQIEGEGVQSLLQQLKSLPHVFWGVVSIGAYRITFQHVAAAITKDEDVVVVLKNGQKLTLRGDDASDTLAALYALYTVENMGEVRN